MLEAIRKERHQKLYEYFEKEITEGLFKDLRRERREDIRSELFDELLEELYRELPQEVSEDNLPPGFFMVGGFVQHALEIRLFTDNVSDFLKYLPAAEAINEYGVNSPEARAFLKSVDDATKLAATRETLEDFCFVQNLRAEAKARREVSNGHRRQSRPIRLIKNTLELEDAETLDDRLPF